MMWIAFALGCALGSGLGLLFAWNHWGRELPHARRLQERLQEEKKQLELKAREDELRYSYLHDAYQKIRQDQEEQRAQLKRDFSLLSQEVLAKQQAMFSGQAEGHLRNSIRPLREHLQIFEKNLEGKLLHQAREQASLRQEIKHIQDAAQSMSTATNDLTTALKFKVSDQGRWGEYILQKILETSGLREGKEYITQGRDLRLKDLGGQHQKPDVLILLPDNKCVIIDSKMSLPAYLDSVTHKNQPELRQKDIRRFIESVKKHIVGLSERIYDRLKKPLSPDFVLLFIPLESTFALAVEEDPSLIPFAWNRRVMLTSPTTLMTSLRVVASLWRLDSLNQNATEIAQQGGAICDQITRIITDFETLGIHLGRVEKTYDALENRIVRGNSSLASKARRLEDMGAKSSHRLETTPQKKLPPEKRQPDSTV